MVLNTLITVLIIVKLQRDEKISTPPFNAQHRARLSDRSAVPTIRTGPFRGFRQAFWANAGILP